MSIIKVLLGIDGPAFQKFTEYYRMEIVTRSINPKTLQPNLSGDELSREECNVVSAWIRENITGDEHPELIAALEWAADFFDYSAEGLLEESSKKKVLLTGLLSESGTFSNLTLKSKLDIVRFENAFNS